MGRRGILAGLLVALLSVLSTTLWAEPPAPAAAPAKSEGKPDSKPSAEKTAPKEDDYELLKVLVDTLDQVERNYVKDVDRRELIEAAIGGMLSKLDPYSNYIGPDDLGQFRANVENEFGGIGIQMDGDGSVLRVLSPLIGTPAYRAGIEAGDRIIAINGQSTEGMSHDEAVKRLKGEPGTDVTITLVHSGSLHPRKVVLTREIIHVETVMGFRRNDQDAWDFLYDHQQRIGYVRLVAFSRESAHDLRRAMQQLREQKLRGLILDLRFNPGGLLPSAIEIAGMFISQGRIVSTAGRNSPERVWDARPGDTFEGFPMVILVNRYSASASEIVSACLQDHQRAVIIGERTWGKGSVQNVIELEGGHSLLKLTTAAYRRPSGKNIHRFPNAKDEDEWGVMPDKGYNLRLSDHELGALIQDRRERDVIRPHQAAETAATQAAPAKEKPATAPAKPAAKVEEKSAKADDARPGAHPVVPAGKNPDDAKKPVNAGASKSPADNQANKDGKAAGEKEKFIDRQLQMALDYLRGELAKGDQAK